MYGFLVDAPDNRRIGRFDVRCSRGHHSTHLTSLGPRLIIQCPIPGCQWCLRPEWADHVPARPEVQ